MQLMVGMKDILAFIPQRPPFVMVDELVDVDEKSATTRFLIRDQHIFTCNGVLTEPALIENMAQTAAARMGYLCRTKNESVPLGFIGAVQHLQIWHLPSVGQTLETRISIKHQVFDVTLIESTVKCNGTHIAECEMKIFIQSTNKSAMT